MAMVLILPISEPVIPYKSMTNHYSCTLYCSCTQECCIHAPYPCNGKGITIHDMEWEHFIHTVSISHHGYKRFHRIGRPQFQIGWRPRNYVHTCAYYTCMVAQRLPGWDRVHKNTKGVPTCAYSLFLC